MTTPGAAAPIQVNYLGFPGTMGADFMDYIVADPVIIADADRRHYSEEIAYLPHSYQANDRQRAMADDGGSMPAYSGFTRVISSISTRRCMIGIRKDWVPPT